MSLWQKLNTLFKATAQEPLEELVDANSIRIFEQELRDAERAIAKSKRELACVIAERNRMQRHQAALKESIESREQQATQALAQQEDALALEIANLIADDEQLFKQQAEQLEYLQKQERYLRQQLKRVAHTVARYHSELRMAKANQNAATALSQIRGYSRGLSSHMAEMDDSLQRIKRRQERFTDYDAAMQSVEADCSGESIEQRLRQSGISSGAADGNAVLERLKARNAA